MKKIKWAKEWSHKGNKKVQNGILFGFHRCTFNRKACLNSIRQAFFIFFLFSKFVPLLLLCVWFITNKQWWVHALIIPIAVYLFQLISVINDSENYMDEVEFIYTVPFLVVICVILYFIRSKISIYIQAVDLKKEMDENMRTPKKFG